MERGAAAVCVSARVCRGGGELKAQDANRPPLRHPKSRIFEMSHAATPRPSASVMGKPPAEGPPPFMGAFLRGLLRSSVGD
eukprot:2698262-Prymnesium_polylepis.1